MRFKTVLARSLAFSSLAIPALAQQQTGIAGKWIMTADIFGAPIYLAMELTQQGDKLSGTYTGDKLEGQVTGDTFHLLAKSDSGVTSDVNATIKDGVISGTSIETDPADKAHPLKYNFTATPAPVLKHGTPQRHEFAPTVYYRQFSPFNKPVLTVAPGDTIHTTTVDAGGNDMNSVKRVLGGNPETGPFYIEGAEPGDTLVVHLVHLKLNRDYAISDDGLDDRAMDSNVAVKLKDNGKTIRWHIDTARGVAYPEGAGEDLAHYTVPLHPMLGCIATATSPGSQSPPGTGDSGGYGGNMDFNEITEGATIYLPVSNPGALLYLGDGHAEQGDGELNGNALETSMDVEFTVDVIQATHLRGRRIETPTHIITMGLNGSLDDAIKSATGDMVNWLDHDYKLTPSEIAQLLGTASEYKISEVADRNAGVVLKINKDRLKPLLPKTK
jgi:acetamidase/formamidase